MTHYILAKITAKRLESNLTQEYMAECLKITPIYYNELETGESEINIETMHNIMQVLGMEITEIFGSGKKN